MRIALLFSLAVGCSTGAAPSAELPAEVEAPDGGHPVEIEVALDTASPPDVDCGHGIAGRVRYSKRLITAQGLSGTEWRPVGRTTVELRHAATLEVLATSRTDADGCFAFADPGAGPLQVVVVARTQGPRVNLSVHDKDASKPPWSATSGGEGGFDIEIDDAYVAGAFNIVQLALAVADSLDGIVPDDVPEAELVVRWDEELTPGCGSCYFDADYRMDIWGGADEEDAHDDSVIVHELGHWVEDAYGYYSNPTGPHNLEHVRATLAWSEGFATWFQGVVLQTPLYLDLRPSGLVYQLDLESPPDEVKGSTGDMALEGFRYSEGLVYGLLWDLVDHPEGDDDEAAYLLDEALEHVVRLLDDGDLAQIGSDLVDFLNRWRCAHPQTTDEAALQSLLDFFEFAYGTSDAPVCK